MRDAHAVHAQHGDVVVRVVRDDVRVLQPGLARDLDGRVALAGDDVGRRDDEIVRREPAAALDSDPARRAEDAHDVGGGAADRLVPRDAGAQRTARRLRPDDRGERVDPREQVQQSLRRHRLVEAADDRRPLHVAA